MVRTRLAYHHPDLEADLCVSANHVRSTERFVLPATDERPISLMFERLPRARTMWVGIKVFEGSISLVQTKRLERYTVASEVR